MAARKGVAPRTGAWIETPIVRLDVALVLSPPARGRGLKLVYDRFKRN